MPISNTSSHGTTLSTTGTYASPLTITSSGYVDNTARRDLSAPAAATRARL